MNIFYLLIVTLCAAARVACASSEGGHASPTDWIFICGVINFILFLIVLYIFALPRIKNFFSERSGNIQQALKEAEEAKILAETKLKEYEKKMAFLSKEIEEIRKAVEKEGELEKERIIAAAAKEAETMKWQAKIIAEQELKYAKAALRKELASLSLERAEKIIKEKINEDDHARLVKDYILQITSKVI
ncbi:MAG: ATP synthase F0 subunit B [Thermodesulfobacteriota bacterium]|jgi:F-type H+-transporting ATPase subunit b|nr:MAG: ATP synthase F0 subunit B [Thermodesulfobacteriota bacterium]